MTFQISDLRQEPAFFDTVADRVWQAWWKPDGYSLEPIAKGLREMMQGERIPFAIVAHERVLVKDWKDRKSVV